MSSLVSAYNATNVTVAGEGLIEGQGWAIWLFNSCNEPGPNQTCATCNCDPCRVHCPQLDGDTPPHLLEFYSCTDSSIEGITLRDSMFWTLHLICERERRPATLLTPI